MLSEESTLRGSSEHATITWWEAWQTALTRPNLVFYESLAQNPSITAKRTYLWIGIAGVVSGYGEVAIRLIYGQQDLPNPFVLLCGTPIFASIFTLIAYTIMLVITHAISKASGGDGEFVELVRPVASFYSPLLIIMSIITLIPIVEYANLGLVVYQLGLLILSVKAVHRIGWGKATFSSITYILFTIQYLIAAF